MEYSLKELQGQLSFGSWKGMKRFSIFAIAEGVFWIVLGCLLLVDIEEHMIGEGIITVIAGIGQILIGRWGKSVPEEIKISIEEVDCIVRRPKSNCIIEIIGVVGYIGYCVFYIFSWVFGVVVVGFAGFGMLVLLWTACYFFRIYRVEKVILKGNEVIYINAYGKQKVFRVEQIDDVHYYDDLRCFYFYDKDRVKLFEVSERMPGGKEFLEKFSEKQKHAA
jgi:hypothetical protein